MATIGEVAVNLTANTAQFAKNLDRVSTRLDQFGSRMKNLGGTLSTSITAPLAILGGGAIKASVDFETAFTGVIKTVDATDEQLNQLRKGIVSMSQELPAGTTEIAAVAEAAGQLGIKVENIQSFTRTMIDLGETTNLSATQAATELARLANITDLPQNKFQNLGSTIVALGNNLATTEAEISSMALRLAGAGTQIGLTQAEILGFAGALSSVGVESQAGGTAFSKVFIKIANAVASGEDAVTMFSDVAGTSAADFAEAFQNRPAQAIQMFVQGLKRMSDSGDNVFAVFDTLELKEVRVRDALLRSANAGELLGQSLDIATTAFENNSALTREAELRYNTVASKFGILKNQALAVAVQLGDALVPILFKLIDVAQPIIKGLASIILKFTELDQTTQTIIAAFGLAFGATGPILVVFGAFVSTLAVLSAPILVGGAIVAGLIAATVAIVTNWEALSAKAQSVWQMITSTVIEKTNQATGWLKDSWNAVTTIVIDVLNALMTKIQEAFNGLMEFLKPVQEFTGSTIDAFKQMFTAVVGQSFVPDMVNRIQEEFGRLEGVMVQPANESTSQVTQSFSRSFGSIENNLADFVSTGKATFADFANSIISDLARIAAKAAVTFVFKQAFSGVTSLAGFAAGGSVTGGMPIVVGEQGPEIFVPGADGEIIPNGIGLGFGGAGSGGITGSAGFTSGATFERMAEGLETFQQVFQVATEAMMARWQEMMVLFDSTWRNQLAVMTEVEQAKTALFQQEESARRLMFVETNSLMLASANAMIAGIAAVSTAIITIASITIALIVAMLVSIASALASNLFTASLAPPIFAAATQLAIIGAISVALAAVGVATAIAAASGAVAGAFAGLQVPALAEGGFVAEPTLAIVGDAPGGEIVAPFSAVEKMLGSQEGGGDTVIVLDGKIIARAVLKEMPGIVRRKGVPNL